MPSANAMQATSLPDWNKIGRKIGRRLRDILQPPSDSGPSREERRQTRLADVYRGFAYFDDFDEVFAWLADDIDPLQRANVPLIQRPRVLSNVDLPSLSSILLCHDYQGGYHDYEAVRCELLDHEEYFCNYLQHVETFVYFSHKLVCCPPPTWTNTLHRNGVKLLGTFCVEPGTLEMEQMLHFKDGAYALATRLAQMAEVFGFDGWLLNIEKSLPSLRVNPILRLQDFIKDLRILLGADKKLIWYDGLTIDNEVEYQNTLSPKNVDFATTAGAIFTNYKWNRKSLHQAGPIAESYGFDAANIYFGIDMWAQNTNMPGPKRVTYPKDGGGGTMTGLAVNELSRNRFSSAIFAPAWPYEHFPPSEAKLVDRSVWEGTSLPTELHCDCEKGQPHNQPGYQLCPIVQSAKEAVAGSEYFFQSDFRCAFEGNDCCLRSRLGSMWPQTPRNDGAHSSWVDVAQLMQRHRLRSDSIFGQRPVHNDGSVLCDGSYVRITIEDISDQLETLSISEATCNRPLRLDLFRLDMPVDESLVATMIYRNALPAPKRSGFYLTYRLTDGAIQYQDVWVNSHPAPSQSMVAVRTFCDDLHPTAARLVGTGIVCDRPDNDEKVQGSILDLYHLSIAPQLESKETGRIHSIRIVERQSGEHKQKRLAWDWSFPHGDWPPQRPWSGLTGPFERFAIYIGGKWLGDCGSMEMPLQPDDFDEAGIATVLVRGFFFGGDYIEAEEMVESLMAGCEGR